MLESKHHPNFTYRTIDDFEQSLELPEGIHLIELSQGLVMEVLVRGNIASIEHGRKIPLFLSSWVTERSSKTGPFFSGAGISNSLKTPSIAIADPLVSANEKVGLAWYLGTPSTPTFDVLIRVVAKIMDLLGRNILAIGGSGAGFASLLLASTTPRVTAFVWNPQTSVVRALESNVKTYMTEAFGGDWSDDEWMERAETKLSKAGFSHDLTKVPAPESFLYLQNSTDYQIATHYAPFLRAHKSIEGEDGRYQIGEHGSAQMGNFSRQHQPPSRELILDTIRFLLIDENSTVESIDMLRRNGHFANTDFNLIPADLRGKTRFLDSLKFKFSLKDNGTFHCELNNESGPMPPLRYQFHGFQGNKRIGGSSKNIRDNWHWIKKTIDRIDCEIWDSFDNHLGRISSEFFPERLLENPHTLQIYSAQQLESQSAERE